jgi:hypothetical protein
MKFAFPVVVVAVAVFAAAAAAQTAPDEATVTGRGPKRACAPVRAKLLEPFFPFDREAIPAGTIALGTVKTQTQPVRKWQRAIAILNGDFTPSAAAPKWSSQGCNCRTVASFPLTRWRPPG